MPPSEDILYYSNDASMSTLTTKSDQVTLLSLQDPPSNAETLEDLVVHTSSLSLSIVFSPIEYLELSLPTVDKLLSSTITESY